MVSRRYLFKKVTDSVVTWILVLILNFLFFYKPSTEISFVALPAQVREYFRFVFVERFGPYSLMSVQMPTLDYVCSSSIFSLILIVLSLVIAIALGVFLGTLASYKGSYKEGRKVDAALTVAALIPFTFPTWWVALTLRSYLYPPFPAFGWYSSRWIFQSPMSDISGFILDFLNHLVLPLTAFLVAFTGVYFLVARNSLREVFTENFMITAKAKGLSPLKIMFKHALRNALIPVVSIIALTPSLLVLSTIMIERVLSRGGLGSIFMKSTIHSWSLEAIPPTPLLQAVFVVLSAIVIILHFIADISLSFLDPRIKADGAGLQRPDKATLNLDLSAPFHRRILRFLKNFMRGYSGKFGLGVILFFVIAGLAVPYLPLQNPSYLGLDRPNPYEPPSLNNLLGTDQYGRDMLAMILWGARSSLIEGLGAVALALAIGYLVGIFSGYYNNRWIGYLLDRITDLFLSVPIIVIIVYFPNIPSANATAIKWLLAVGLTTWPFTAKLVRAAVISAKDKPFIEATRAAGAGDAHILFRCLFPDCVPAAASSMPILAVTALSVQSSLDYLGFQRNLWSRIDPVLLAPYTSWGTILSYGAEAFFVRHWWVMFPPAICIALLSLALVAIGHKTMEVTNPRLERSHTKLF